MKKRLGIISLFVILFIAFITTWDLIYISGNEEGYVPVKNKLQDNLIPSEDGVFKRSKHALDYSNMPVDEAHQRSLNEYYKNRAFHGAPPSIPHPVKNDRSMGEKTCLKCHQNGGFVEIYKAYAPVTPHPEMVNCRQCHVPQHTSNLFKENYFPKINPPKTGVNNALIGSPPAIPHQVQMHENCLSCHAGPSAPKEIRTTHPERINCRQCHAENNKETIDIGIFKRTISHDE